MAYPTISIISTLYNTDLWLWEKTLRAIASQEYPKNAIEHIVMDGGSTNGANKLAERYGCRVYSFPKLLHNACARNGLGVSKAKKDLILLLEPDNIIVGKQWLKQMVQPFLDDPTIICTYSMKNTYEQNMPALTRYFSLIGINDPLVYFLGKSEKIPLYENSYHKGDVSRETKSYYITRFTKSNLPTLGDNGHMVRRLPLQSVVQDPYRYLHTDEMAKLLDKGFDTYGVVKNSLIHYSGSNLIEYIRRRTTYKRQNYDSQRATRKYLIFDPSSARDRFNLIRFIVYSLSIFPMVIESVWGYIHKKDSAWFMHPIVCLLMVVGYGWSEMYYVASKAGKMMRRFR
jgi:glycosyltransferase involved in cell wall biosynthesis